LIYAYKKQRTEMYKGYIFPIGDLPNDASWTGFQNYNPESSSGYLTLFREINNTDVSKEIKLVFLKGKTLQITNLLTGTTETTKVDINGNASFSMSNPASYLFLKYTIN
jgi:hypothetical protein